MTVVSNGSQIPVPAAIVRDELSTLTDQPDFHTAKALTVIEADSQHLLQPSTLPETPQPPSEALPFRWHALSGRPLRRTPTPPPVQLALPFTASFRFFSLPAEIRRRVYELVLPSRQVLSRPHPPRPKKRRPHDPSNPLPRLPLFLTTKRFHNEATQYFYSTQAFRLFPLQDEHPIPTIIDIAPRYRNHITCLEFRLGSSWTNPPKSWRVTKSLGLNDLHSLRTFNVFVEFDPSHPFFKNFRISKDFYTDFSGILMRKILFGMPKILECVKFDANPSVELGGPLMKRLIEEVKKTGRLKIGWGEERGWADTWYDQIKI